MNTINYRARRTERIVGGIFLALALLAATAGFTVALAGMVGAL